MVLKFIITSILSSICVISFCQKDAFIIYNSKGRKVNFSQMKNALSEESFVFFGEFHDNPISHWMELEITKDLYNLHGEKLKLGFEMFEQDQQGILNDYIKGVIDDTSFSNSCRLWLNYSTDYDPIVQFAKQKGLFCLASNVPRVFASRLFKKGRASLDTLSDLQKTYVAPLDFKVDTTLSQYAALLEMGAHMGSAINFVEAQAIKDATMAYFLLKNWNTDEVFLHFNGAYHTDYYQGIIWYLLKENPDLAIATITTVSQDDTNKLEKEHFGKADFIICVDNDMTKTH
jgi:uncharacterized iron-regulated protein